MWKSLQVLERKRGNELQHLPESSILLPGTTRRDVCPEVQAQPSPNPHPGYVSGGLVPMALGTAFHQVTYRPGSRCLGWPSPSCFLFISHCAFFSPILYAWKAFQQQYFFQEKPQGPRSVAFKMSEGWIFSLLEMASVGWNKPSDEWTLRGSKLQLR